jgi:predicted 2-oxoglutarate/Fe(II)-dependent dioxygenase YbiX
VSIQEVAPGIYVTRAFEADEAADVVATAVCATTWQDAGINANLDVDRSVRDAEVLFESSGPSESVAHELMGRCRDRLFVATRDIAIAVAHKTVLAEIQIVRYHPGGRYIDHRDSPELGATPRALSLVCYLNDDFSGGETVFTNPNITIPIVTGTVVAFSPVLMHRANPVLTGTKYIITAWYHTPPARVIPSGAPNGA